eukprot:5298400-Amphidinium_carterae.1
MCHFSSTLSEPQQAPETMRARMFALLAQPCPAPPIACDLDAQEPCSLHMGETITPKVLTQTCNDVPPICQKDTLAIRER